MSNFKFNCPSCGQKILGDTGYIGSPIPCPTCRKPLTVPRPSSAAALVAPQSLAATIPLPAMQETRPEPKKLCRLAVASLICSLVPGVGSIPGIICGHLATSRIRSIQPSRGTIMATVGLVIGYFFLAATVVYFVVKHTD